MLSDGGQQATTWQQAAERGQLQRRNEKAQSAKENMSRFWPASEERNKKGKAMLF